MENLLVSMGWGRGRLARVQPAPDSLERLVPDALDGNDATGRATLALHLDRYAFAAEQAVGGRLLDIACGVGYGTRLLYDRVAGAESALGVDLSEEAVAYARERYGTPQVAYRVGDALGFEDPIGFDTIVCLETLEHVGDPGALIARLAALLRPGGVLVASVPTTPSVDLNPHHRCDFSERSFRRLLADHHLREVDGLHQVQPVPLFRVLGRSERRMGELRPHLLAYYLGHPGSLLRRAGAILRHGLTNHYLTVACRAAS
jgi:SAM-dependent methyltransferase